MNTVFNTLGVNFLNTIPQTFVSVSDTLVKAQAIGLSVNTTQVDAKGLDKKNVYPVANWVFEIPEGKYTIGFYEGKLYCSPYTTELKDPQWTGQYVRSVEEAVTLVKCDAVDFCVVDSVDANFQFTLIFKKDGELMCRSFDSTVQGLKNCGGCIHFDIRSFYQDSMTYADTRAKLVSTIA